MGSHRRLREVRRIHSRQTSLGTRAVAAVATTVALIGTTVTASATSAPVIPSGENVIDMTANESSPSSSQDSDREPIHDLRHAHVCQVGFQVALEEALLCMVEESLRMQRKGYAGHYLHDFSRRLWLSRYTADAQKVLDTFLLDRNVMEELNRIVRLRCPSREDVHFYRLYVTRRVGRDAYELEYPTSNGIDAWRVMSRRLVRGQSELAKRLSGLYGY